MLTKLAYGNPGRSFTLGHIPEGMDLKAVEELVMLIVNKVGRVKRVQGSHRD